jgi:hypothetical protein
MVSQLSATVVVQPPLLSCRELRVWNKGPKLCVEVLRQLHSRPCATFDKIEASKKGVQDGVPGRAPGHLQSKGENQRTKKGETPEMKEQKKDVEACALKRARPLILLHSSTAFSVECRVGEPILYLSISKTICHHLCLYQRMKRTQSMYEE